MLSLTRKIYYSLSNIIEKAYEVSIQQPNIIKEQLNQKNENTIIYVYEKEISIYFKKNIQWIDIKNILNLIDALIEKKITNPINLLEDLDKEKYILFINYQVTRKNKIQKSIFLVSDIKDSEILNYLKTKTEDFKHNEKDILKLEIIISFITKDSNDGIIDSITVPNNILIKDKTNNLLYNKSQNLQRLAQYFGIIPDVIPSKYPYLENNIKLILPKKILLRQITEERVYITKKKN